MQSSILIIEDEKGIRKYLKDLLSENGYRTSESSKGSTALELLDENEYDLVILDLGLPDISGETICSNIKKNYPDTHVIMLTGKKTTNDVVQGFRLGADDYIKKPFQAEELMARVRARLKEYKKLNPILKAGDLKLNVKSFEVHRKEKKIDLTPQEFRLLKCMMENQNQVLTRQTILNKIWANSYDVRTRVVDVYIGYLRKKIDKGYNNKLIHSIRGFGYVLKT